MILIYILSVNYKINHALGGSMNSDSLYSLPIKQLIYNLKKTADPLNTSQTFESYEWDKDYDVVISIKLKPKKSQYQLGMEMFK